MAKNEKELDKDLMFQKIMPAIKDNPFSTVYNASESSNKNFGVLEAEDNLTLLRKRLFNKNEFYEDINSFATINIMETLITKHIDSVITKFNSCSCDRCKCDIAAYALNLLPPKYIVAKPENIQKAENEIPVKQIMDALIKAVIFVRSHPQH